MFLKTVHTHEMAATDSRGWLHLFTWILAGALFWLLLFAGTARAVTYTLDVDNVTVKEQDGTAQFTVDISPAIEVGSTTVVTVNFATSPGTAEDGSDYTGASGTLEFTAGETAETIIISITDDGAVESSEQFTVNLSGAASNKVTDSVTYPSGGNTATGTIQDNDYNVTITGSPTVTEGSPASFNVTISPAVRAGDSISVTYSTTDGTAHAEGDYASKTDTLSFAYGDPTTKQATVQTNDDAYVEAAETFTVTLNTPISTLGTVNITTPSAQGTIQDDGSDTYEASITAVDPASKSLQEGGSVSFTIGLTNVDPHNGVVGPVNVDFVTDNGSAEAPGDYTDNDNSVTFENGDPAGTTKEVSVNTVGDGEAEPDETFDFRLTGITAPHTFDGTAETVTIVDDDYNVTITATGSSTVTEGSLASFDVTVTPAVRTDDSVTVTYSTSDGSAYQPGDYQAKTNAEISFAPGESTKQATVQTNDDAYAEATETFFVTLTGADTGLGGTANITGSPAQGNIEDDGSDAYRAVIKSTTPSSLLEANASVTFTIELQNVDPVNGVTGGDVTVTFVTDDDSAIAPGDYTDNDGSVVFRNTTTVTTQDVTVTVNADIYVEPDETFDFRLTSISGTGNTFDGTASTITITNDDLYQAYIQFISKTTVTEGTDSDVTFRIALSSANIDPVRGVVDSVQVSYAVTGGTAEPEDYSLPGTSVTIDDGNRTPEVVVGIVQDGLIEDDETFDFELTGVSGTYAGGIFGDNPRVITIQDDDEYTVSITGSPSVAEGETASFDVTVSPAVQEGHTVTVTFSTTDGSAEAPGDFAAAANTALEFNYGDPTTKQATVATVNDTETEPDEDFTVELTNAISSEGGITITDAGPRTATIRDNDYDVTITATGASTVTEGSQASFDVTISPAVRTGDSINVTYSTTDGTAHQPGDYQAKTDSLSFAYGDPTTKQATVQTNDDSFVEATETFTVTLNTATSSLGTVNITTPSAQGNIEDDGSDTYTASITAVTPSNSIPEGQGVTFTIALEGVDPDNGVVGPVTVDFVTDDGTAMAPGDYADEDGSVTFQNADPAGTTKEVSVNTVGDGNVEPDETFSFRLTGITAPHTFDGAAETVTIVNNDNYHATISSIVPSSVTEGDSGDVTATVTISLSNVDPVIGVVGPINVNYRTQDYSAKTGNNDYDELDTSVTFANGTTSASQTVDVTIHGDTYVEIDEYFTFRLDGITAGSGNTYDGDPRNIYILNDDTYTASITSVAPNPATEGTDAQVTVRIEIDSATVCPERGFVGDVDVYFATTDGTAKSGSDYTPPTPNYRRYLAGTSNPVKDVPIIILNDTHVEDDETLTFRLTGITGGHAYDGTVQTITIQDDTTDEYGVSLSASPSPATEGTHPSVTFTATLLNLDPANGIVGGGSVTVDYAATGAGTATEGSDYTLPGLPHTLTFSGTDSTETVSATIVNDSLVEENETLVFELSNLSGPRTPSVSPTVTETVTILDDDSYGVRIAGVSPDASEPEGSTFTFTVELTNVDPQYPASGGVNVTYVTDDGSARAADGDYTDNDGTIIFSGVTTAEISVVTLDDTYVEGNETLTFRLTGISGTRAGALGSPSQQTVTIEDSGDSYDATIVSVVPSTVTEGAGPVIVTIGLTNVDPTNGVDGDIYVEYQTSDNTARAPGDYTAVSGQVHFAPGSSGQDTVSVAITDDSLVENTESFNFELVHISGTGSVNPSPALDSDSITIEDNDYYVVSMVDATPSPIPENQTPATFGIEIQNVDPEYPPSVDVTYQTVNGTAEAGSDYVAASGTVTLTTGGTTNVTVEILNDELVELLETFTMTLTTSDPNTIVGDATGVCQIEDNDFGVITIVGPGGTVTDGTTVCGPDATCDYYVNRGDDKTFTINVLDPEYYDIKEVLIDGVPQGDVIGADEYAYTFSGVTENHTLEVSFTRYFKIEASAQNGGTINPSGDVYVVQGENYTFYVEKDPGTCYVVDDVLIDGTSVGNVPERANSYEYTFINVQEDHTIAAQFDRVTEFIIAARAEYGGAITPAGQVAVRCNQDQTFNITAGTDNWIEQVLVDSVPVTDLTSGATTYAFTFSNVTSDHYILAKFGLPPGACEEISDIPLDALIRSAPPLIMFLMDDSGSMDWEFMTPEAQGTFLGNYYVYDDPGDNAYPNTGNLSDSERKIWRSQWYGYNRLFYKPGLEYEPWPNHQGAGNLPDADPDNPRSNPTSPSHTATFPMDGHFVTLYSRGQMVTVTRDCSYLCDNNTCADAVALMVSGTTFPFSTRETAGSDDAEEEWDGDVTTNSGDLDILCDGYAGGAVGIRFQGVDVAPGDTITEAYIEFTADESTTGAANYTIRGQLATNPATFSTTGSNITSRPTTASSAAWSPPDWTAGQIYQTAPVTGIVQEIVNQGGWASGNPMVFIFRGTGCRVAESYEGSATSAPRLVIKTTTMTDPIIIDNRDAEFDTIGTWRESSGSPEWDGSSLYTTENNASAIWSIQDIPENDYDVYAWASATSSGRSREARYDVYYGTGGSSSNLYLMDQRSQADGGHAGEWYLLGTHHFVNEPGGGRVDVPNSHYYITSGGTPYLVIISGTTDADPADGPNGDISYYVVDDTNNNGYVDAREIVEISETDAETAGVRPRNQDGTYRTYEQERQNFANWYSFYRRRELASKAAVGRVIDEVVNSYVGINTIHNRIYQNVLPVRTLGLNDESDTLLTLLYNDMHSSGGTPLRSGLRDVGIYFDDTDGKTGYLGESPYAASEIGGACQQAFTIAMTDGYWNGAFSGGSIGNVDGDNNTAWDGPPYDDNAIDTLADVAMYYYENDLSDLDDELPDVLNDGAIHQHMVTYGISFGLAGTLDPADYNSDLVDISGNTIVWTNPYSCSSDYGTDECPYKIDDLYHAATNGRGLFITASDPEELVEALLAIMENIAARQGSASSLSVNGDELWDKVGEETRMFQASYSTGDMTGNVMAYSLDPITGVRNETPVWEASGLLETKLDTTGHTSRIIATYNPDTNTGLPFTYDALLTSGTTAMREQLQPDWSTDTAANVENMVNFIRGDKSFEAFNLGPFRDRARRLGDIVHSSPLHVNDVLFVGSNDGMLYALDAITGEVVYNYVPGLLYDHLKEVGNPRYKHKYYVDLTPIAVSGVTVSGGSTDMLVGGLGKGGKGYYALNITPASGTTKFVPVSESDLANRVMWEYPRTATPVSEINDMGYSYSLPFVVRSNDPAYPWIVGFGNGYNSNNAHAVLFILDPSTGTLVKRIDTLAGNCNGLSSPIPIDENLDGKVDFIYAGDLKGNMWKFDMTSSDHNLWDVAFYESGTTPQPHFQARGPAGSTQPITSRPDVMSHCARHGNLVLFATGKFLNEADIGDGAIQSVYGIWDYAGIETDDETEYLGSLQRGATPQLTNQPNYSVSVMEQAAVYEGQVDIDGDGIDEDDPYVRVLGADQPDWSNTEYYQSSGVTECGDPLGSESGGDCDPNSVGTLSDPIRNAGWYYDFAGPQFNAAAERVTDDVMIRLGTLIFATYTPENTLCSAGGGHSWVMEMDACTGGRLSKPQFDLNGDGILDENDMINIGTEENPILVPPTGWKFEGRLQPPVILLLEQLELEKKYFSTTKQNMATVTEVEERPAKVGLIHWLEREQR